MKEPRIKKTPNQIRFEKAERLSNRLIERLNALESRLERTRREWLTAYDSKRLAELQLACEKGAATVTAFENLHSLLQSYSDSDLTPQQIVLRDEINRRYPQQKKAAA
jgi:hypothetical protein